MCIRDSNIMFQIYDFLCKGNTAVTHWMKSGEQWCGASMLCILVCGRARISTVRRTKAAPCLALQGSHSPIDIIVYGGRRRQTWTISSNRGVGRTTRRMLNHVFLAAAIPQQSRGLIAGGNMQFGRIIFGQYFRTQLPTPIVTHSGAMCLAAAC